MIASAHIIGGGALGGAELFYIRLVNALHAQHQPVLAISIPNGQITTRLQPGVAQDHAAMRGVWDWPSRWRIQAILRDHPLDIVQTYLGRATRLTHVPPGCRPIHVARLGGYYDLKSYRHAHAWIGNTLGLCDYLRHNGLPAARIAHIANFVDLPAASSPAQRRAWRQQLAIAEDALVVLAVGRLHPVKGFEDLLLAISRLDATLQQRPLTLLIVGHGPISTELRDYANQLGISHQVHWAGWQQDPHPYYELADLFVCPSRHETLGNVILEAWAHRRPVLATQTAGASELITHGENGWLVPPEQPQQLAEAIRQLLHDEPLRMKLAQQGCAKVVAHYSAPQIITAYLEFYQRLLTL